MTHAEHIELVKQVIDGKCIPLLESKGYEYSRAGDVNDDTLANFKRIAAEDDVHPLLVWHIYLKKHMDAIATYVRNTNKGKEYKKSEPIEGRFVDAVNYLLLGLGLVKEAESERGRPDPKIEAMFDEAEQAEANRWEDEGGSPLYPLLKGTTLRAQDITRSF